MQRHLKVHPSEKVRFYGYGSWTNLRMSGKHGRINRRILFFIDIDPRKVGVSATIGTIGLRRKESEFCAYPLNLRCGISASRLGEITSVNAVAEFTYGGRPDHR